MPVSTGCECPEVLVPKRPTRPHVELCGRSSAVYILYRSPISDAASILQHRPSRARSAASGPGRESSRVGSIFELRTVEQVRLRARFSSETPDSENAITERPGSPTLPVSGGGVIYFLRVHRPPCVLLFYVFPSPWSVLSTPSSDAFISRLARVSRLGATYDALAYGSTDSLSLPAHTSYSPSGSSAALPSTKQQCHLSEHERNLLCSCCCTFDFVDAMGRRLPVLALCARGHPTLRPSSCLQSHPAACSTPRGCRRPPGSRCTAASAGGPCAQMAGPSWWNSGDARR